MGLHWYELVPLVLLALVFFGPKRLPEMGSAVGKTIKEFRKSMNEITEPTAHPSAIPPTTTTAAPQELAAPSAQPSALPIATTEAKAVEAKE
ncbi:MAG: twin-arginine translocase TatA/TatE family subunit [Ktedonobacterales bacterium]|nr:twin-arginine translocase TatA/TatE family subunit [Ktedonobacterales bacterium]